MQNKLDSIKTKCAIELDNISDLKTLDGLFISILGKNGELTQILKTMGSLPAGERPKFGQLVNTVREEINLMFANKRNFISMRELNFRLASEKIDTTMPAKTPALGGLHPLNIILDELTQIFIGMGFDISEGPEIETNYYNFDALNISQYHPARSTSDTFYIDEGFSLRTATSPMQVRKMERGLLPIRTICPGRVFRADEVDATHSPIFHQLEGLVVDKNISMATLKGTLDVFAKKLFGETALTRFRPHYFPFTEPSAEMDVSCFSCGGEGCRICKNEGFIEILGCGMVHPKVLQTSGIDPTQYSGFAFGMGLERIAMQRFGITDLRLLYENDVKFLSQFI